MFLEMWQIAVMLVMFCAGMFHVGRCSFKEGMGKGVDGAIAIFENQGLLKTTEIEEDDEINVYFHKPTGFHSYYEKDD